MKSLFIKSSVKFLLIVVAGNCCLTSQPCLAEYRFDEAVRLPGSVNTSSGWESTPAISSDGLELFYTDASFNIKVATRDSTDQPFRRPRPAGNGLSHPSISKNGLELFGNFSFGNEDRDIGFVTRDAIGEPWGNIQALGENVNGPLLDRFPSISPDGLELYFQRSPSQTSSDGDMWVSRRNSTDDAFGPAVELPEELNVGWAAPGGLSPDGLTFFFSSDRPGGFGRHDLYYVTRDDKSSPWGEPINLGPTVNTAGVEFSPRMSFDGSELYFARFPETFDINDRSS